MSLVVTSNLPTDATTAGRDQSIFKPYSFRNALSSTMTLPKNCQVALESVKYNLDGTLSVSGDSYIMYFYFGETLDYDENMDYSTAYPIRIPIINLPSGQVKEFSFTDLVVEIQNQLNKFVFHPNLRDKVTCSVRTDATSGSLEGLTINFDQYDGSDSTVPTTTKEFGNPDLIGQNAGWTYENGSFTTNASSINQNLPAVALLSDKPISLNDGELIVDFSSANDANIDWRVGLSRYVNRENDALGKGFWPMFMSDYGSKYVDNGPQPGRGKKTGLMFADYLVCRVGEELKVCHTSLDDEVVVQRPTWLDVVMGNSDVPGDYNLSTNASSFEKVKFTCSGQRIKIEMLEADDTAHVLYDYDSTYDDDEILKPINQSCWTMYPVLSIERDETVNGQTLVVEDFIGCDNISNHDIEDVNNSWYQSVQADEVSKNSGRARELETRPWNNEQEDKATYNIQADVNGSGAIDLSTKLITQESLLYTPSFGANVKSLLGFPTSVMTGVYQASPTNRVRIESTDAPQLLSSRTMFVRLENFTQETSNARAGNRSKIIAHLPRETATNKRIFHQPAQRVYLDLNNSEPLKVNSFDISFCYTNEQYATNLTGQSVVCLHFKEKGS